MGSHDVVGLFLLAELVAVVPDSVSVVSRTREEVTSEPCMAENNEPPNTSHTKHVEGASGCCAQPGTQHVVEGAGEQRHGVREGALTEGVDQNTVDAAATGAL